MPGPMIIALWSAPRCRSTAFLRMMAERGDFHIVHEPFSHVADFGVADVGGTKVRSETGLISELLALGGRERVFFKDTTDFRYPALLADTGFLRAVVHTFIIRHPARAAASHYRLNPQVNCDEIGFARVHEIYRAATRATGRRPAVIEADDLIERPEALIRAYCRETGIPFIPEAMSWNSGVLEGWQRTARWHVEVSTSTGFGDARRDGDDTDLTSLPAPLHQYAEYHLPYYEMMREHRLTV